MTMKLSAEMTHLHDQVREDMALISQGYDNLIKRLEALPPTTDPATMQMRSEVISKFRTTQGMLQLSEVVVIMVCSMGKKKGVPDGGPTESDS